MSQYIPNNWPYDKEKEPKQEGKNEVYEVAFCIAMVRPQNINYQWMGCFKARWMAMRGEQLMRRNASTLSYS